MLFYVLGLSNLFYLLIIYGNDLPFIFPVSSGEILRNSIVIKPCYNRKNAICARIGIAIKEKQLRVIAYV